MGSSNNAPTAAPRASRLRLRPVYPMTLDVWSSAHWSVLGADHLCPLEAGGRMW